VRQPTSSTASAMGPLVIVFASVPAPNVMVSGRWLRRPSPLPVSSTTRSLPVAWHLASRAGGWSVRDLQAASIPVSAGPTADAVHR
jgi:hypothetical protein